MTLREVPRGLDVLRLPRVRLLDEDVLARLQRAHRPLVMQRSGQRDVHGVDTLIGKQLLVGAVRALDAVLACVRLRARAIPRAYCDDLGRARRRSAHPRSRC